MAGGNSMSLETVLQQIKGGLIVSCQALEDEPLHSPFIMSRMAKAALESGATAIRANSIADIQCIKDANETPVIGIIKKVYGTNPVFITPTLKEVRALCSIGCEVVAMDGTLRERPQGEKLAEIVATIRAEYPEVLLMADCATIADAKYCQELDFDLIATTLHGYTEETKGQDIADNDFSLVDELLKEITKPLIVEGNIDTPEKLGIVMKKGAYATVVGSAITRPQVITKKFVSALPK